MYNTVWPEIGEVWFFEKEEEHYLILSERKHIWNDAITVKGLHTKTGAINNIMIYVTEIDEGHARRVA